MIEVCLVHYIRKHGPAGRGESRGWGRRKRVEGLVSVERWSFSSGASCGIHYEEVEGLVFVER